MKLAPINKTIFLAPVLMLGACASMQTAIEHKDLNVQTKASNSVFLEPVPQYQKTVYVDVKNTSDKTLNISPRIKKAIELNGYNVVNNPKKAHYLLQANILKVGKMSKSASSSALGGGYGSALSGLATGAALASFTENSTSAVAGGLIGGVVSMAADSLVKDVNYTMVTDIRVSEKSKQLIDERTDSRLSNGATTQTIQNTKRGTHWKRYQIRVVSNADKVNLKFADARLMLEDSLIKVIAGIF